MTYAARTLLSFMSFNVGWWACALGASHGFPWAGPVLLPVLVGIHLKYAPVPRGEALFFVGLAALGFGVDTGLIRAGLFTVIPQENHAPLWLVAMWVLLGLTWESMLMMRKNRILMIVSAAASGPFTYYCGEAMEILTYARPLWISLTLHGIVWTILTPLIFRWRDWCLNVALNSQRVSAEMPAHPAQGVPQELKNPKAMPIHRDKP